MSSLITSVASPEANSEPDPGIVQNYKARLQLLVRSPSPPGHDRDPDPYWLMPMTVGSPGDT